ncbi:hypothetical protein [Legionella hackeliae]|uniref:Uncharacterized protein n=1 Tax=Legionella hackeliae TaxID=449 RepID=A0A0A8URP0_LEGHA|nr:hypothetical protein [Legionella hackeliae]CEK11525.1 protein of unknown function [Legionella hackeliae]
MAPTVFKLSDPEAKEKAHAFYRDILKRGIEQGFVEHRVPIPVINSLVDLKSPYWALVKKIKDSIDPDNIIASDKYW